MTKVAKDPETTALAGDPVSPNPADDVDQEPMHEWVPARQPKPGSKTYQLIRLLSGKTGADVVVVSQKFGWQIHTTRAAISGLRQSGYPILHVKGSNGKPSRYRITGPILRLDG
jgi:hypothetical protein